VNAIVNYTLGEGVKKLSDFEIRSDTGEVCISGDLDYEMRNSYEFPIIATDRGKRSGMINVIIDWTNEIFPFYRWLKHHGDGQNTIDRR
jgi:protocadherin-16/23